MSGLVGLIDQLVRDGRAFVLAEIQLAKAHAAVLLQRARVAIVLILVAVLILFASIIALMLGLVMALAPLVGAALAGAILLAAGLGVSGLLLWAAVRILTGRSGKAAPGASS